MAAETSWHRYGTKLRHCHPMYTQLIICRSNAPTALRSTSHCRKAGYSFRRWRGRRSRCRRRLPATTLRRTREFLSTSPRSSPRPSVSTQWTQQRKLYTPCPKKRPRFIFWITLWKLTDFNNFLHVKSWGNLTWKSYRLSTSPVRCSDCTLGNPKKVVFNSIIHT